VAESRPHSKVYSQAAAVVRLRALAAEGFVPSVHIVKSLAPAEVERLPKLSEIILEFGKPILQEIPPKAPVADLRQAMVLVELAWNAPVLMQHGTSEVARRLKKDLDSMWPKLPQEAHRVLKTMMVERATTYGRDPRLARVYVKAHANGEVRVHADAYMLDDATETTTGVSTAH
jgi:hypothetical protein